MNKEEKRINNKCNFIDNLLLDNGLYKGVSILVEIEEHISNLYDEIDEYKKQLEEKDKVIDEAFKLSQELKEQIELTLNDYNKERTYENAYEQIDDIEYHYEDIKEIVEILERGKK